MDDRERDEKESGISVLMEGHDDDTYLIAWKIVCDHKFHSAL